LRGLYTLGKNQFEMPTKNMCVSFSPLLLISLATRIIHAYNIWISSADLNLGPRRTDYWMYNMIYAFNDLCYLNLTWGLIDASESNTGRFTETMQEAEYPHCGHGTLKRKKDKPYSFTWFFSWSSWQWCSGIQVIATLASVLLITPS